MAETTQDFWAHADHDLLERWPKDSGGHPEQAVCLTLLSELGGGADVTLSMLESYGIPAFKYGSLGKVLFGFAGRGVELYVPASRLEEARELLSAQEGDDGGAAPDDHE